MFRVDDPRWEPRVLHEMTQNKMGEDAESDFAIPFVDENDYSEIEEPRPRTYQKQQQKAISLI